MDFGDSVALQRVNLRNLQPDMNNIFIVGIIIAKQKPRKFLDAKGVNNDSYKGVWNFTLRDSPRDYINVTYWGKSEDIISVSDKFHIGNIVEVVNPKITVRKVNDYGEQFRPMVTSPYALSLNEHSQIVEHGVQNNAFYLNLLKLPTKPIAGFVPLHQVQNNGRNLINEFIDILGVLRGCRTPRTISTSFGDTFQVVEVELFDFTAPSLKISIYDSDIISRSTTWTPRYTVLFFTDLKVNWSDFERAFITKCTSRTVVTENPACKETALLLNYAKTAPIETFDIVDQLLTAIPEPNQIQDVMSVNQVQNKINAMLQGVSADRHFSALLYAIVTDMDLDGLSRTTFIKCGHCKVRITTGAICENPDCPTTVGRENIEPHVTFDLRISVSDHTGTLLNCYFRGEAVENTFSCTVQDFLLMNDDQKRELKWRYILERCAVRIFVLLNRGKPLISVASITKENEIDVAQKIPVY